MNDRLEYGGFIILALPYQLGDTPARADSSPHKAIFESPERDPSFRVPKGRPSRDCAMRCLQGVWGGPSESWRLYGWAAMEQGRPTTRSSAGRAPARSCAGWSAQHNH